MRGECMKHFLTYVKYSYDVIIEAERKTNINLDQEVEIFIVHTVAKYMDRPNIPTDAIAMKMLKTVNETGSVRKDHFKQIAEECLLIDGFKLNSRKWPTNNYFKDMGIIALEHRAYSERPPELMYERIASKFDEMSYLLNRLKTN